MLPVILSGCRPRNDGSWSVTLSTNILKEEEQHIILRMHNQLCCVMIKDSEVLAEEIEAFDSVEMDLIDTKRKPSQKLRDVFYRLWEQEGKEGEFKEFYRVKMEMLIEHYKLKLD